MKAVYALLAVALAFAIGYLANRDDPDPDIERLKATATARADTIKAQAARIAYLDELAAEADSLAAEYAAREDSIAEASDARVSAAQGELDRVVAALPDSVRAAVEDAVAEERAAHQDALQRMAFFYRGRDALRLAQIQARDSALVARDSMIAVLGRQVATQDELVGRLEDKLRPDIDLGFVKLDLSCTAGLSASAGYGRAAGVGLTCGVTL